MLPKHVTAWPDFGSNSVTGKWSANTYDNDDGQAFVRKTYAEAGIRDALDSAIRIIADRRTFHLKTFDPVDEMAVEEWEELERLIGDLKEKDFIP